MIPMVRRWARRSVVGGAMLLAQADVADMPRRGEKFNDGLRVRRPGVGWVAVRFLVA
jgi:hypothetical protein